MSRKRTDQLLRLAFDDVKNENQVHLSEEETREVASYRRLRSDLRLLNDIPPHQLSNERLRDAVLGQGLKPVAPAFSVWNWLWMPAAAGVLAFTIVMLRPRRSSEPQIMLTPPAMTASGMVAFRDALKKPSFEDTTIIDHSPLIDAVASPSTVAETVRPIRRRPSNAVGKSALRSAVEEIDWSATVASISSSPTSARPPVREASETPAGASNIVIIDQDRNAVDTTPRATEIGNPSNVLIGG